VHKQSLYIHDLVLETVNNAILNGLTDTNMWLNLHHAINTLFNLVTIFIVHYLHNIIHKYIQMTFIPLCIEFPYLHIVVYDIYVIYTLGMNFDANLIISSTVLSTIY
jgi:hypothetical protein